MMVRVIKLDRRHFVKIKGTEMMQCMLPSSSNRLPPHGLGEVNNAASLIFLVLMSQPPINHVIIAGEKPSGVSKSTTTQTDWKFRRKEMMIVRPVI